MSELVMLKKENMNLRKQLKGENRKLFFDINYYVFRHDISKQEYQLLINEVLVDFTNRANLGEKLWDTIENPKEYSDKYIDKYGLEKKNWRVLTRLYAVLFLGCVCFYFIFTNFFSPSSAMQNNPWLIEISSEGFFKCLGYSTYGLYFELLTKATLFKKNKALTTQKILVFFGWALLMFILLAISGMNIVTITLPKVIIYLVMLICITLVYLLQRERVL